MTDEMGSGSGDRFEVAVIGAGQAGLAMGYYLAKEGRRFVIFEAAGSIGAAWRARWDSLVGVIRVSAGTKVVDRTRRCFAV